MRARQKDCPGPGVVLDLRSACRCAQIGDEAVLTERPQNDKVPKNFLILNLAPAADAAAVKAPASASAQQQ